MGSRSLRLTAHETDLDYGPALLANAAGEELGIVPALAQMVLASGTAVPLWSKLRAVSAAGVDLIGKNEYMEWTISVRAEAASRGVGIDLRILGKKRLPGMSLELLPFQTVSTIKDLGGAVLLHGREEIRLRWSSKGALSTPVFSEDSGLVTLRTERFTLTPSLLRLSATISPAERGISRV